MKAKRSICNGAYFRVLARRGWPLWTVYLVFLTAVMLNTFPTWGELWRRQAADYALILHNWETYVLTALVMAVVTANVVFFHLHDKKQTALVCALPLSRGEVYRTCFLAGLVPMLGADVLAVLACAIVELGYGVMNLPILLYLLALLVMLDIAFYGFAAFCAVLTGAAWVLPLVYLVLQFAAEAVDDCLYLLPQVLLYGCRGSAVELSWLSPVVWLTNREPLMSGGVTSIAGRTMAGLGLYCAAGIAFAVLGQALHRQRAMENAGEVVAVPWLRPVFRYCMGFGCALVLACVPHLNLEGFRSSYAGPDMTVSCLALALAGGAVGWFGAEMLMRKTLRVFDRWKGFCVVGGVSALLILCLGLDVAGYETRVPDVDTVERVVVACGDKWVVFDDAQGIELAETLHRLVIDGRDAEHAAGNDSYYYPSVYIFYHLKDGGLLQRLYGNILDPETAHGRAVADAAEALLNSDEAYRSRARAFLPEDTADYTCVVQYPQWDSAFGMRYHSAELTPTQAEALYAAVLLDLEAHAIDLWHAEAEPWSIRLWFEEYTPDVGDDAAEAAVGGVMLTVDPESFNTLDWLMRNLGITPLGPETK